MGFKQDRSARINEEAANQSAADVLVLTQIYAANSKTRKGRALDLAATTTSGRRRCGAGTRGAWGLVVEDHVQLTTTREDSEDEQRTENLTGGRPEFWTVAEVCGRRGPAAEGGDQHR
jgi:hypothetical protein